MTIISTFQERLAELMNGMSVTDMAAKLGVSKQTVSAWLCGTRKPKDLGITAIAMRLSVHPAWLMGYDVDKHAMIDAKNKEENEDPAVKECIELFRKLSDGQKAMIIASMKGILNVK